MWFTKFLNIMSNFLLPNSSLNLIDNLSRLNPDKFYIENVRSILDVPYNKAKSICEEAVRQGVIKEHIEILCPDGTVAISVDDLVKIPKTVPCWEEVDGDYDEKEYETSTLEKQIYYRISRVSETQH